MSRFGDSLGYQLQPWLSLFTVNRARVPKVFNKVKPIDEPFWR